MKQLKDLETENNRLRRAVSDLTLDKLILQEAARETSKPRAPPSLHWVVSRIFRTFDQATAPVCMTCGW